MRGRLTERGQALLELALSDSGEDDGGGEEEEDDTFSTLSTLPSPGPTPLAAADTKGGLNLAHLSDDQRVHLHELIGLHQVCPAACHHDHPGHNRLKHTRVPIVLAYRRACRRTTPGSRRTRAPMSRSSMPPSKAFRGCPPPNPSLCF